MLNLILILPPQEGDFRPNLHCFEASVIDLMQNLYMDTFFYSLSYFVV